MPRHASCPAEHHLLACSDVVARNIATLLNEHGATQNLVNLLWHPEVCVGVQVLKFKATQLENQSQHPLSQMLPTHCYKHGSLEMKILPTASEAALSIAADREELFHRPLSKDVTLASACHETPRWRIMLQKALKQQLPKQACG